MEYIDRGGAHGRLDTKFYIKRKSPGIACMGADRCGGPMQDSSPWGQGGSGPQPPAEPAAPPPNWYPDPQDAARFRYWDGNRWTERTRPAATTPLAAAYRPLVQVSGRQPPDGRRAPCGAAGAAAAGHPGGSAGAGSGGVPAAGGGFVRGGALAGAAPQRGSGWGVLGLQRVVRVSGGLRPKGRRSASRCAPSPHPKASRRRGAKVVTSTSELPGNCLSIIRPWFSGRWSPS
jgi:hypothetical protein